MARSRRLGIAGEVSVWQIPENSVNHARVNTAAGFFFAQDFGRGVFLMGKTINDRFANKKFERKNLEGKNLDGRFPYWKNDYWSIFQ